MHFTVCKFDLNKVLFLLNTVLVLKELTVQYVGMKDNKRLLLYLYDGGFGYQIWGTSPQQESGEPVVICKNLTSPLTSLQHLSPNFSSVMWIKYKVARPLLDAKGIRVYKLSKHTCSEK